MARIVHPKWQSSIKQLMVILKRKNSRCSIHHETSQGHQYLGLRICFTHSMILKKAIKLNMYYEYHFFLTTSMMPFITSVSKRNHSHVKNRFSGFLPGTKMLEFIVFFEAWRLGLGCRRSEIPRPSLVEEAAFQVTLWGFEIDLNRVILWNLHQRSKPKNNKRLAETERNDTTLLQNKQYNYKQSKPQKCVRNPGKRTCEDKQNLIKSCKRSGIFKYFCVFGFPWDGSGGVPQV